MADRQIADDPGRQLRDVWLGHGVRWAWDWTYQEWGIAFTAFVLGGTLITWVLPAGLVVAVLTWRIGRAMAVRIDPDQQTKYFRIIVGCVAALCAIISLNPVTWIKPLFLPVALLASLALPRYAVKTWGGYVDWNRPIAYWLRLPRLVAAGPRLDPETEYDVTKMIMAAEGMSHETGPIEPGSVPAVVVKKTPARKPVKATITTAKAKAVVVGPHKPRWICRIDGGFYSEKFNYALVWRP